MCVVYLSAGNEKGSQPQRMLPTVKEVERIKGRNQFVKCTLPLISFLFDLSVGNETFCFEMF